MSNVRRVVGFTITVILSFVFPIAVIAWAVDSFLVSSVEPFDFAVLKDGEICYSEYHPANGIVPWSESQFSNRLKCVNALTGIERTIDLKTEDEFVVPLWTRDEFYLISANSVYKLAEGTKSKSSGSPLKLVARLPNTGFASLDRVVFLYDGELTTIAEDAQGNCELMHLRDGQFVRGRKIRRPPANCTWYEDPTDGRKMFQPKEPPSIVGAAYPAPAVQYATYGQPALVDSVPTAVATNTIVGVTSVVQPPPTFAAFATLATSQLTMWSLQVQQDGEHVYVYYVTNDGFCAYRDGLDFDDTAQEGVSALAAENMIRDANGWQPIPNLPSGHCIQNMLYDRNGALFSSTTGDVIRKSLGGAWSTVSGTARFDSDMSPRLIVDWADRTVYVVGKSGDVLRIEGDSLQPTAFKVPDHRQVYLARWQRLLLEIVGAWLLHYFIVALGTMLLTRNAMGTSYEFGIEKATLASISRRGFALTIDLVIIALTVTLSVWIHFRVLGMNIGFSTSQELTEWLTLVEGTLEYGGSQGLTVLKDSIEQLVTSLLFDSEEETITPSFTVLVAALIDTGLFLWLLKVYDEGRYGATPGKWLLGIRTRRTTLRKCGFARAMVRDVLYWVDLLGFVTPLPAAASIVFSSYRQRWGDRVADTIVINSFVSSTDKDHR